MKIRNINIQGGNQQFADKIINNSNSLTEVDKAFVDLIHKNTGSDDERRELIKSLETIKDVESTEEQKEKSSSMLKKFLESSTTEAGKQIVKELIENGADYLEKLI